MKKLIQFLIVFTIISFSFISTSQAQMLCTEGDALIDGNMTLIGSSQSISVKKKLDNSDYETVKESYCDVLWGLYRYCDVTTSNAERNLTTGDYNQTLSSHSSWANFSQVTETGDDFYDISFAPPSSNNINWESRFHIDATGNTGIGTAIPSQRLDVNGSIRAHNIQISSDKRYKKGIKTLENSLDKITKLRGTEYDYRIDKFKDINFDDRHQIGFIAQEIQEVLPELVHEDLNGYLSVNYQGLIPVLTEAIKEINAENTLIKVENKQLKTEFSSLQNRVQQLEKLLTVEEVSTPKASTTNIVLEDKNNLVSVYPNPFNNVFTISYQIKGESTVSIKIVDNQGKEVSLLANKDLKSKGMHQVNFNAEHLARGIYYYTIETDEYFKDGKIIKQ